MHTDIHQVRRDTLRRELRSLLESRLLSPGPVEPVRGIWIRRVNHPTELGYGTSIPSFCVIAQGAKEIRIGDRLLRYDPETCLVSGHDLPYASRVTHASPEEPYLSVVIRLDPMLVGNVLAETATPDPERLEVTAMAVTHLETDLLDAVVRLVRTLDEGEPSEAIRTMILREIILRLLASEQSDRVRQVATMGESNRIRRAITLIRSRYDEPLRIESLASELGMSVSSLHHRFKEATAMSPLQFQKQIRLQEARRLMLGEELDATRAGLRVGYGDASYFNRDYKRLFGHPPGRDIQRLRLTTPESASTGL